MKRACLYCGSEFELKRPGDKKKYCTLLCSNRAKAEAKHAAMPVCLCKQCGKEFVPNERKYTTFCSRECAFTWQKEHVNPKPAKPLPKCKVCGKECPTYRAQLCSDECRKQLARDKERQRGIQAHVGREVVCQECGRMFVTEYGSPRKTYCSKECHRRATRRQDHRHNSFNGRAREVLRKQYGDAWREHYEWINRARVLQADGYRCHICGCKVRKTQQWEERQATVDHVVPLAVGGEHKYTNVRCACQMCNSVKSKDVTGQARLLW